ncbi:MAG: LysM peptidoglycan-binding domain-containing protein [Taibaiella sp.]|nr:LysM peptidoglycan-binding domain-containing protein [Taibaiella sp.]
MMHKLLITLLILLSAFSLSAKQSDSLFVINRPTGICLVYKTHSGETVFSVSQRFHVPPAMLAGANGVLLQSPVFNRVIYVPLGAYNLLKEKPATEGIGQPLYYKIGIGENLYKVSKYTGATQQALEGWNMMPDNYIPPGQVLVIGWVRCDTTDPTKQKTAMTMGYGAAPKTIKDKNGTTITTIIQPAPPPAPVLSAIEQLYVKQTDSGKKVNTEKGSAVFFDTRKSTVTNNYYAFHNTAPRGTIIKVSNAASNKTIYVKVIGPIPDAKQYYNCVIAISGGAREALGSREMKAWCELTYTK